MSRIIINTEGMSDDIALSYVLRVITTDKPIPHLTTYIGEGGRETNISLTTTKKGTRSFRVWRETK